jgi:hypothetical protein
VTQGDRREGARRSHNLASKYGRVHVAAWSIGKGRQGMKGMSALDGQPEDWRQVLLEETPQWGRPDGETPHLKNSRPTPKIDAINLTPCNRLKIIGVH